MVKTFLVVVESSLFVCFVSCVFCVCFIWVFAWIKVEKNTQKNWLFFSWGVGVGCFILWHPNAYRCRSSGWLDGGKQGGEKDSGEVWLDFIWNHYRYFGTTSWEHQLNLAWGDMYGNMHSTPALRHFLAVVALEHQYSFLSAKLCPYKQTTQRLYSSDLGCTPL